MRKLQAPSWTKFPIRAAVFLILAGVGAPLGSSGPLPPIKTVFLIVEENRDWSEITPSAAPYIRNTLAPMGAHAEQYYTPPGLRPSEPNYIWLEAGSNLGIRDNAEPSANHQNTTDHLVRYLNRAGISWKAYMEDISGKACPLTAENLYAPKHNPFVFFDDVTDTNNPNSSSCIAHIRPYAELAADLQNHAVARYNFIVPNLCNDMHDCGIAAGDAWLSREVPKILASQAYRDGGALFLTWDEGSLASRDEPIGMIVLSPFAKTNYSNSVRYTHSSMLRTLQEIFSVMPLLRDAANAANLSDLFVPDALGPVLIHDGGIVNNASYSLASSGVAPGSIVAIFGRNLTDGRSCLPPSCHPSFESNRRLNTSMTGAQVAVNGTPAPILYSSPGQLGVQVPTELTGDSASVQVTAGGQPSLPKTVFVLPVSPGIFTFTSDGKGQAAITHADGLPVSPQRPAHAGESVILYATGLGQVTPSVPTGAVPDSPSVAVAPSMVTIDDIEVIPEFAGLAGCCVGLYQLNFRLPTNTRSGNDIPVLLSIAGVRSNTATIAVE